MRFLATLPSYASNRKFFAFRKIFRSPNKILVIVILLAFLVFCISPILFLPDLRGGLSSKSRSVYKVYNKIKEVVPELIIPPPPFDNSSRVQVFHHDIDRFRNKERIKQDMERLNIKMKNDVKPHTKESPGSHSPDFQEESTVLPGVGSAVPSRIKSNHLYPLIQGGQDPDPGVQKKREKIIEMTLHGWKNYKLFAWGKNELRPISRRGHNADIFGADMGATIVDAMDLLYIIGLMEEFEAGKEWIRDHLNFDGVVTAISVFETNIRFIGGLLTLYSFTNDPLFREKAYHIGQKLLPAFDTPTGIPHALINIAHMNSKNYAWASGASSILSEFGTLHLEFVYLSDITGDPIFREKVFKIRNFVQSLDKVNSLYPNYLNPVTGHWGQRHHSLGALGDSFYEYLLKSYIQSGFKDMDALRMYQEAISAIDSKLVKKSKSGLVYFAEQRGSKTEHKMDHLACFAAGMYGLGASVIKDENSDKHKRIGIEIARTCHESYDRTPTKIGPESFRFSDTLEAKALMPNEKYYILRPEVIEGWFIQWRLTHDQIYRDWAWEAVLAIDKHCRVANGFSGIKNVYATTITHDDVQQSFFFAETLKYLYLIFSDDSLISLDEWVFNTEGHPLPIEDRNAFYRPFKGWKEQKKVL